MEAGEYVPDGVTNSMVAARLVETDAANGFILDGYCARWRRWMN